MADNDSLALWKSVQTTDPKYTKPFSRGGGFKGTAINATWLHMQATEAFGPMGLGWGVNVIDEKYVDGAPGDKIHVVRIILWYKINGERGEIESFGQTAFTGKNKNGPFTDEEAPKKSLTDATTKALSHLGFAADVHLGLYDDNRYVNDVRQEFREREDDRRDDRADDRRQNKAANDAGPASSSASTYDDDVQVEIKSKILKEIADCETIADVTGLMQHRDVVEDMRTLPKEVQEEIRDIAKKRLVALGWKSSKAAS